MTVTVPIANTEEKQEEQAQAPDVSGNTVVVLDQGLPGLFGCSEPDYCYWCCCSAWCHGIALKNMGDWLGQMYTVWFPVVWALAIVLGVCQGVFTGKAVASLLLGDWDGHDLFLLIANICRYSMYGLVVILGILTYMQRRFFIKKFGLPEDIGMSVLLTIFCEPCMLGQMGAYRYKKNTTVVVV